MAEDRRRFLRSLSAGLMGSVGLLLPRKLLAGHWRQRGGVYCPAPVVFCPAPIVSCPEGVVLAPIPGERFVDPVTRCYPALAPNSSGVTIIPGLRGDTNTGTFCAWVRAASGVMVTGTRITTDSGGTIDMSSCTPWGIQNGSNNPITTFIYWNCTADQFYLTFLYSIGGTPSSTATGYGPFQLGPC